MVVMLITKKKEKLMLVIIQDVNLVDFFVNKKLNHLYK